MRPPANHRETTHTNGADRALQLITGQFRLTLHRERKRILQLHRPTQNRAILNLPINHLKLAEVTLHRPSETIAIRQHRHRALLLPHRRLRNELPNTLNIASSCHGQYLLV